MGYSSATSTLQRSKADRLKLVQTYGSHSLAYSTLQAGMEYFDTAQGYIAYCKHTSCLGKTVAVLGDPIASSDHFAQIIYLFAKQFPQAIFWQLGRQAASVLSELGFYVNDAGLDSVVDLQAFCGSWRTHSSLRRAANKATRHSVVVREQVLREVPKSELERVSESWLAVRKNRNQRFLTRPLVLAPEPDVRHFFAFQGSRLVGYRVFDPLYSYGEVIGYYADAVRVRPDAPPGTTCKIMLEAIHTFKAEGKQTLTLGYSPFAEMRLSSGFNSSPLTYWFCSFTYHNLEKIYRQKGLSSHKRRFHGVEQKVYLASKSLFPLKDIISTCYLTGINLPRQLFKPTPIKVRAKQLGLVASP